MLAALSSFIILKKREGGSNHGLASVCFSIIKGAGGSVKELEHETARRGRGDVAARRCSGGAAARRLQRRGGGTVARRR